MMYAPGVVLMVWACVLSLVGSCPMIGLVAVFTLLAAIAVHARAAVRRHRRRR